MEAAEAAVAAAFGLALLCMVFLGCFFAAASAAGAEALFAGASAAIAPNAKTDINKARDSFFMDGAPTSREKAHTVSTPA